MPTQKTWVFDPDSGGVKIPAAVKQDVLKRIHAAADEHLPPGLYTRLDIRFKAQFCYIDAFQEPPKPTADWPPKDWPETREVYLERLRNTPIPLCRLRYFGGDTWGFALYTFSQEKYELSVFPNGEFFGGPEEAFLLAASFYLDPEAPP